MKIDVTWEVEDGYAGKSRPQHTSVDLSWFQDHAQDLGKDAVSEIMNEIEAHVHEDFQQRITYYIDNYDEIKDTVQEFVDKYGVEPEREY